MEVYGERMSRAMMSLKQIGVEGMVFGDIIWGMLGGIGRRI